MFAGAGKTENRKRGKMMAQGCEMLGAWIAKCVPGSGFFEEPEAPKKVLLVFLLLRKGQPFLQ